MSDSWDFYFSRVNDASASIFVDLGIRDSVPDPARPWFLGIRLHFLQPRQDGLSSAEEAPVLDQIEDALWTSVRNATGSELVGRITTSGHREFCFYGPRTDGFPDAVAEAMTRFPGYEYQVGTKQDPGWLKYLNVLCPSPEENQCMQNRRVIESLGKHGDPLTKPRPVNHWVYFASPQQRDTFIAKAVEAGFKVTDQSDDNHSISGRPYGVTLERIDRVDWNAINSVTLELFRFAQEVNGDYDGWETSVEKEDAR